MTLRTYLIARILLTIPMIFILLTMVFVIIRVLPGDPVLLHFEKVENPVAIAQMRHALGLDKPLVIQYFDYIWGLFHGDLGKSMENFQPVSQSIFSAFPATLELAIYSMAIAVLLGLFLGVEASKRYNTPQDHAIRVFGIVTYTIPVFFLGMILQLTLGVWLHWFPIGGRSYPTQEPIGLTIQYRFPTPPGGFIGWFLISSVAAGATLLVGLLNARRRHQKCTRKNYAVMAAVALMAWILVTIIGWFFISTNVLTLKTGLFTVDSLLEGNIYKFIQSLKYLFLPSFTLGLVLCGVFIRLTRSNMFETMRLDFVTAARARGLTENKVTYSYALRNAFLPILTLIGLEFATLLGGAVLTETTFSWPGIGRYIVDRISQRDYTAIQGAIVVFGLFVSAVSLVVDVLYAYLDPRIRL